MNVPIEYWDVVELVWDEINIYVVADVFLSTYSSAKWPAGQLYAAHFAQSEICNGGFHQLFWNSTGILSPEAAQGFELIRMPQTANLVTSAMEAVGSPFPRERSERQKALERVSKDRLDRLDQQFCKNIDTENGGFEAAADAFVNKQRESIFTSFPSLATRIMLYVATSNPGKLRDFAAAARRTSPSTPLPNLNQIPAPPEDEPTFEGNARLKALYYSHRAPGQIVIADDSGLEVDALNGAPGVRSARYADDHHFKASPETTTDERNNLCLLQVLSKIPTKIQKPATTASSPPPATERSSPSATAPSKARSSPPHAAQAASATTPSSISPKKTRRWPSSTSKPSSPSATAAEPSPHSSKALLPHLQPSQIQ